jgi:phosphoglucosamine mutase
LIQGIRDNDGEAYSAGIIPTSAVSLLTQKYHLGAGIVISASHNPYHDNGIKIFSPRGKKIPEEWEVKLEEEIKSRSRHVREKRIPIKPNPRYAEDYISFLKSRVRLPKRRPKIKMVLDCANGASSMIAPRVFNELGFEVEAIHNSPDGKNINRGCGSLHPHKLAKKVLKAGADIGIAFDGDTDRAVWVDEKGKILNGDHTLFVQALFMKDRARLKTSAVVATILSNMGLETALRQNGLELLRTRVGDKYVLEKMIDVRANLGGEQSGHTIFLDDCPTGDGILTGLKMLEAMVGRGLPLSRLSEGLEEYPQTQLNIRVAKKIDFKEFPEIIRIKGEIERALMGSGRMELRYSGTEPLARVMVEGRDKSQIEELAQKMGDVIAKYLSA